MGIRTKLSFEVGFLILFSFFVAGIFLYFAESRYIVQKSKLTARKKASELSFHASNLARRGDFEKLDNLIKEVSKDPGISWAGFQDRSGIIRIHSNELMKGVAINNEWSRKALEAREFSSNEYQKNNSRMLEFSRPVFHGAEMIGAIRIVYALDRIRHAARRDMMSLARMYLLACVVTCLIGVVLANMSGFSIVRRIQSVKKGAEEISRGNIGYRMKVSGKDEIAFLTHTFNTMSGKLKELDRLKDEFISRISHELKSPVSVIKGFLEKLNEDKTLSQKSKKYIKQIVYGTDRLEHLVNQTLNLSKIKAGKMDFHFEKINLDEVIPEIVGFFQEKLPADKISLVHDMEAHLPPVKADSEALCEVLANLLSNAIKFTRQGEICVWAKANGGDVQIGVKDTGVGIPSDQIENIFGRFNRVQENKRKVPESKGTGLGLAIVKSIVESHHGTIHVESTVDKGTDVSFSLPIYT